MRLAFDRTGAPTSRPLVLLHGLSDSRESYLPVVDTLRDRFQVLNVDLRGHGASAWADKYGVFDYVEDIVQLLDTQNLGPAVMVGHSLGGVVASALTARHPEMVEGLFLEDPSLYAGDETVRQVSPYASQFPDWVQAIRHWQISGITEEELAPIIGDRSVSTHDDTTLIDRWGWERVRIVARSWLAFDPAAMEAVISGELWVGYDPSAPMSCPVKVLFGDPEFGAEFSPEHADWYAMSVPQAQIVGLEGVGHFIHFDPEGFKTYMKELYTFLSTFGQDPPITRM